MCCRKKRAMKAQAALEANRLAGHMAQMRLQDPRDASIQTPGNATRRQSIAPSTLPPPYADTVRSASSEDLKEKPGDEGEALHPSNGMIYGADDRGATLDGTQTQPQEYPSVLPGPMPGAERQPVHKGCYGSYTSNVPWYAYADQKFAKKCAKWHRKRCVDSGCWCRAPMTQEHMNAGPVY